MASLDEYLKAKPSGRSVQGPPVAPRQIGNPSPGAKVAIDPDKGFMPFLSPHPTTPAPQGMSGRGRPVPFAVPDSTPRPPQKNPLAFLDAAPVPKPTAVPPLPGLGAAQYAPKETISNLGDYVAEQDLSARTTKALGAGQATSFAQQIGGTLINPAIGDAGGTQSVVAQPATLLGYQDGKPQYQTDYRVFGGNGEAGTASITGPDQRVGGGTVSAPDQGNGGTVEGNVAAINRQAEALRSLREARNPGITTGDIGQVQAPKPIDPWARPGDSFGDSQRREQEYASLLSAIQSDRGWGAAKRNQSRAAAAQAMIEPGIALARTAAEQQGSKDNLAAHLAATAASRYNTDADLTQRMLAAQRQAGLDSRQAGMDNARLALDQRKQHLNELTQTNNRAKGEYDLQREADLAKLWESIKALPAGDPRAKALSDQYMLLKRGMEPKQDLISQLGL